MDVRVTKHRAPKLCPTRKCQVRARRKIFGGNAIAIVWTDVAFQVVLNSRWTQSEVLFNRSNTAEAQVLFVCHMQKSVSLLYFNLAGGDCMGRQASHMSLYNLPGRTM
jgi:hypothetical protein